MRQSKQNPPVVAAVVRRLRVTGLDMRGRRAVQGEWDQMLAWVAGFEMSPGIFAVLLWSGARMLVRSRAVMVLRVIVAGVRVGVQRKNRDGRADEGEADHKGDEALHGTSLWKAGVGGQT